MVAKNIAQENLAVTTDDCQENTLVNLIDFSDNNVPEYEKEFFYIARFAAKRANGRKIVTFVYSEDFKLILKKYFGLEIAFGVSLLKEKFIPEKIKNIHDLNGKSHDYYLISLDRSYDPRIYDLLSSFGYKENIDFIFRTFKPVILNNCNSKLINNLYNDYGLIIETKSLFLKKLTFSGFNNILKFGKIFGSENLSISLGSNQRIEIRDNVRFMTDTIIDISQSYVHSNIIIEDNCVFGTNILFKISPPCNVRIGRNSTFGNHVEFHGNMGNSILIGNDCMIANDVEFLACDGYTIYDVISGHCNNYGINQSKENFITLKDHVWVGKDSYLLRGAYLNNGSIVGAKSVVKTFVPNNCIVAGNPGRVIKSDIIWTRSPLGNLDIKSDIYANSTRLKNTVLILGGTGRMSSYLTKLCLEKNYDVTIATRGIHHIESNLNISILKFDRFKEESYKCLKNKHFDVIIDCSCYAPQCITYVLRYVSCNYYILISSFEVYSKYRYGFDLHEIDLPLVKNNYDEFLDTGNYGYKNYAKGKLFSEQLLTHQFSNIKSAIVRIPFVLDADNYMTDASTLRLLKYVDAVINKKNINSLNINSHFSFADAKEEARFLIHLFENDLLGVYNFALNGSVNMMNIIDYVQNKTGISAAITDTNGDSLPFTNHPEVVLNLNKCLSTGFVPSSLNSVLFGDKNSKGLIDNYISHISIN